MKQYQYFQMNELITNKMKKKTKINIPAKYITIEVVFVYSMAIQGVMNKLSPKIRQIINL